MQEDTVLVLPKELDTEEVDFTIKPAVAIIKVFTGQNKLIRPFEQY